MTMKIKWAVDCLKKSMGCKSMGIGCYIDTIEECRKCSYYVSDAELDEALNEIVNFFDKLLGNKSSEG